MLLQVGKGGANMGFFGNLGHTEAAKPGGKSGLSQSTASQSQEAGKAGSEEAGTHASEDGNAENRGRWGELEEASQQAQADVRQTEDTEQQGRWGEDTDTDTGKAAADSGGPAEPVALPLDVRVDRGKWRLRQTLTGIIFLLCYASCFAIILQFHMAGGEPLMQSCLMLCCDYCWDVCARMSVIGGQFIAILL